MSGRGALVGVAGLTLGLAVGLGIAAARAPERAKPNEALAALVRAQSERLQALEQAQRRSAGAVEAARRQAQPAVPAVDPAPAAPDPALRAETARRLELGRSILKTALAGGHWTEEHRLQYREQLTALEDDKARGQLLEELSIAVNSDKLRVDSGRVF